MTPVLHPTDRETEMPATDMPRKRILFISSEYPPRVNASGLLNQYLCWKFPLDGFAVLHEAPVRDSGKTNEDRGERRVAVPDREFPGRRLRNYLETRLKCLRFGEVARAGRQLIRDFKPDVIFATYPEPQFFVAGYLLSREFNLPLHAYFHDFWSINMRSPLDRIVAAYYEPRILREAEQVYAITEEAAQHLQEHAGVKPRILRHPTVVERLAPEGIPVDREPPTVVFSGSIYSRMNLDTLVAIARAINGWKRAVQFVIATPPDNTAEQLQLEGIAGPNIRVVHPKNRLETIALLQRATVLCLPLAFSGAAPDEIRTVFSFKATDYLVSRRPILVVAPGNSHTVRYAREAGWAEVVTSQDPIGIRSGITRILDNPQHERGLVANAVAAAHTRDRSAISSQLWQWLQAS